MDAPTQDTMPLGDGSKRWLARSASDETVANHLQSLRRALADDDNTGREAVVFLAEAERRLRDGGGDDG